MRIASVFPGAHNVELVVDTQLAAFTLRFADKIEV